MSVEYLGCFELARSSGQGKPLQDVLQRAKLVFMGSQWQCELTPERGLACEETSPRDEARYLQECWQQGKNLSAEFGTEDLHFDLRAFTYRESRFAALRVTSRSLLGLIYHLDEQKTDLFRFIAALETALASARCAIGAEVRIDELLDFVDGKLSGARVAEGVKIASQPADRNLALLTENAFTERWVGARRFFVHDLTEWDMVYGR